MNVFEPNEDVKLFLCRHGQTEHNAKDLNQGHLDVELNEKGREQARKLAERAERMEIDSLYSSSLKRAAQTAEIISEETGLENETLDGLKEQSAGVFENEPWERRKQEIERSDKDYHEHRPENGENYYDVKERAIEELRKLRERHRGENVLAVGHGHTNRVLIVSALGYGVENAIRIDQDNTCVNLLRWHGDWGWLLSSVNDTHHLE